MRKQSTKTQLPEPPKYETDFIADTSRHLGILEGKVDTILQRLDSLADSYKTINHNSTQMATRLDRLEQRQEDADRQRTRIIQIFGVVIAAIGVLLSYLAYTRFF